MSKQSSTLSDNIASKEQSRQPSNSSKDAIPQHRRLNNSRVQNVLLIWLDNNIGADHNDGCRNRITELRRVVDNVNKFTDCDQCIDFLSDIYEEKVFMILSCELSQRIVPLIHDITQLHSIYILCGYEACYEQWAKWSKIKGVFTDITPIYTDFYEAAQQCEHDTISISFMSKSDISGISDSKKNLDQLDCSFMYTEILKDILLTIQFEDQHIKQFIDYCREVFADNNYNLNKVNNFEQKYREETPIWWYTSDSFLYLMLNRALRTMDVGIIVQMGFFIRELHQHLQQLHFEQFGQHPSQKILTVYRGQSLSKTDFDQLVKTKGGLISFNSFLSTSKDRDMSLTFAHKHLFNPDIVGILFVMTIDPSISSAPFASINDVSCFMEDEVLFSMHTVFRIHDIKQMSETNRLWEVNLILTSDNDQELRTLTEHIRGETSPNSKGWYRLGAVLLRMSQWEKAQQVYEVMLDQTTDDHEKAAIYSQLGFAKKDQGKYGEALLYYEKSLEISQTTLAKYHPELDIYYNQIGSVYYNMGEYLKALSYYEKTLEIQQKSLPSNHLNLGAPYNNIGAVYFDMSEYSKALSYYEKGLEIHKKSLPSNHPDLAKSYNNIGAVYFNMDKYSKALSYYEKGLEIHKKSLPPYHLALAESYTNIGNMCNCMNQCPKALLYYEKALEINQKSLPPNQPDLGRNYNNIGVLYERMREYSMALSSYKTALKIYQKSFTEHHPVLVNVYEHIGRMYHRMGDYFNAPLYSEKVLGIRQKSLPANHPDLAASYNNVGLMYDEMGDYLKALSYLENALEIYQKSLPVNHPNLAKSYGHIGCVYSQMSEYSKALSYFDKALEISQKSFSPTDPHLAYSLNNIGFAYANMNEYSKAVSYFKRAVDTGEQLLSENHPDLQNWRNNLDLMKKHL